METYDKMKQKSQKAQLEVKLREEERDKALNKSLTQVKIIEKLIAEHKEYENKLEQLENLTKECAMLKEKLAATEEQLEDANNEVNMVFLMIMYQNIASLMAGQFFLDKSFKQKSIRWTNERCEIIRRCGCA